MPALQNPPAEAKYEIIDVDPHFKRVVSYMRPSDYGVIAATTVGTPLLLNLWGYLDPVDKTKPFKGVGGGFMRVSALLGFAGGFLLAYQRSSLRFWGWSENSREVKKDRYEIKSRLARGEKPYGESNMEPWLQKVAAANSTSSQVNFAIFPFFNFVHHPYHGTDLRKYFETRPGEEEWGLKLPPYEELVKKGVI